MRMAVRLPQLEFHTNVDTRVSVQYASFVQMEARDGGARAVDGQAEGGPRVHPGIDRRPRVPADPARDWRADGHSLDERRERSPEGAGEEGLPRAGRPEIPGA